MTEAVYPPNHPAIGGTLEALGRLAEAQGERAEARALYEPVDCDP